MHEEAQSHDQPGDFDRDSRRDIMTAASLKGRHCDDRNSRTRSLAKCSWRTPSSPRSQRRPPSSTSVTGIIQGTTTLEAAFQKMGQSIAISLGETAVKEGVDALKKALKELLQSQLVQDLVRRGIGIAGGAYDRAMSGSYGLSRRGVSR
jgi:hypothetical protein